MAIDKFRDFPPPPQCLCTHIHHSACMQTLFQNGRHFSILLFTCKLAHVASFLNPKFKEYFSLNEATEANLKVNKRIPNWRPLWNKAYLVLLTVI